MSRRLPRVDAVLVQAVIAGALSFAHLHDLAEAAGQTGWKAWAYPVSVDLLLVAAWHRLRSLAGTDTPRGSAWAWFTIALAASLGANVATAGLLDLDHVPNWLRVTVAGWPALAFLGGTLLAHNRPTTEPEPVAGPVTEEVPSEGHDQDSAVELPAPAPVLAPAPLLAPAPVAVPPSEVPTDAAPASEPVPAAEQLAPAAPTPAAPAVKGPTLPPALLVQARTFSADYKRRTGYPADAEILQTRLNLPPAMADALALQLT